MEFRCEPKLHGEIINGRFEVRCDSRWCGKRPDNVILHRFDLETGQLIETVRFKNPHKPRKETDGTN